MGQAKNRRIKTQKVGLILPTDAEVQSITGTEPATAEAAPAPLVPLVPSAKTELNVSDEIDSVVRVIGEAISADMKQREVRTVSVVAALFRVTSNITKTYLTQCAKQDFLDEGSNDIVRLSEIQDNDLANYIAALRSGMGEGQKAN